LFNIGPTELIVILIVALIVFGPKRLPEIGRTLGRSLQEFRRASSDLREQLEQGMNEDPPSEGTKASWTPSPSGAAATSSGEEPADPVQGSRSDDAGTGGASAAT
jgi:sec-independent protein translocase protein TatA